MLNAMYPPLKNTYYHMLRYIDRWHCQSTVGRDALEDVSPVGGTGFRRCVLPPSLSQSLCVFLKDSVRSRISWAQNGNLVLFVIT